MIERLNKQVKKMRKSHVTKKSVEALWAEVKQVVEADNLSFDILIDPTHPHPAQTSHDDPTTFTEDPCLASSIAAVMHDMFTY